MSLRGNTCTVPNGQRFAGWLQGSTTSTTILQAGETYKCTNGESVVFYANWVSAAPGTYGITWNTQQAGMSVTCDSEYTTSSSVQYKTCVPGNVNGKTFVGWCTNANGTIGCSDTSTPTQARISANMTGPISFYAKWDSMTPAYYTINLDDRCDGSCSDTGDPNPLYYQYVRLNNDHVCDIGYYESQSCNNNENRDRLIVNPVKSACSFLGYFTAASGGSQTIDNTGKFIVTPSASTTWYAHWDCDSPTEGANNFDTLELDTDGGQTADGNEFNG